MQPSILLSISISILFFKLMKRLFFSILAFLFSLDAVFATVPTELVVGKTAGSIINGDGRTPISILTLVQSILVKVVLPVIVIGTSLYIAYELFTAEGDETKLKKAWKSVAYTAIALIAVALSYALVSIISRISI